MSPHRPLGSATVAAVAIALSGCLSTNDPSSDAGSDEAGIQNVLYEEMVAYADPDVRLYDGDDVANDPVNTLRWRREVLRRDRSSVIEIDRPQDAPPTAFVTLTCETSGLLHLFTGESDVVGHLTKDFADAGTRSTLLQRVRRDGRPTERHRGWELVALSGVEIASPDATRRIKSVRIQAGDVDETVTGVSELVRIEDLLHLPLGVDVTVTVDTGDPTDATFLHLRHQHERVELEGAGDGTFTGTFRTGGRPGPRHFTVDVLSHGSLFDREEAYDSAAWGIPVVVGGEIAAGGA